MKVYRITKRKYAADLSGRGAAINAGRWNRQGTHLIYSASTRALAVLECLVHLDGALLAVADFVLLTLQLPSAEAAEFTQANVLEAFRDGTPKERLQSIGDQFVHDGEALYCHVPSLVLPEEHNILINPRHPDAAEIQIVHQRPFHFDRRLG